MKPGWVITLNYIYKVLLMGEGLVMKEAISKLCEGKVVDIG
jgi:hypothetical protein